MVGFHQLIISIWKPGGNHSFSPGPGFHNRLVIFLFTRCWFLKNGNGNVAIVGPRCASSNCLVLFGIAWYCVVLHGTGWYCMILRGIAMYSMVLHDAAWYCMVCAWFCRTESHCSNGPGWFLWVISYVYGLNCSKSEKVACLAFGIE